MAKTRGKLPILTHKSHFCARNARKRGFLRPKKHKNPDFVPKTTQNPGKITHSDTKTPILCSGEGDWHREAQPLPSCKSPSTAMKVNSLVMRYLHFGSVRGDFLERRTGQVAVLTGTQHLRHCLGRELPTLCQERSAPSSLWRRQE